MALPAAASAGWVAGRRIALGMDNFSVRAFGWKAPALIDYAASLGLDVLMISDLDAYESLEDGPLSELRKRAADRGLQLHAGSMSVCPSSKRFNPKHGTAEEHLRLLIRVARALGSPVARCVLGSAEDRRGEGGIATHIRNTVAVCKAVRSHAVDCGVKIAIENHAGDMTSHELVGLIEEAGRDYVGATMDSGNATWALEDPLRNLEVLAPFAVTSGMRDSMVWETPEGAVVQWTAMGDGCVDFKRYVERFSEQCPRCPFVLEIISGLQRPFPIGQAAFMEAYAGVAAEEIARFRALAKLGRPIDAFSAPSGPERKAASERQQKEQLERSVRYCREVLGLGLRGV